MTVSFSFPTGGGAAQVPYGNAPVIPAGLEGKSCKFVSM